jgi:hypothetical protein
MWPFKHKEQEAKDELKLDMMTKMAHSRILKQAENAIRKSYKQGRLVFLGVNTVSYTEKNGKKRTLTLDACASLFYRKLNDEFSGTMGAFGAPAGLATLGIFTQDIREIISKLKEEAKK